MMNNSIADRRSFEWKGLSTMTTLPYEDMAQVSFKRTDLQGFSPDVNRVFKKLVDNDLYNEQLVLNIKEGRNIPGATVTNLSQTVINSGDGQKFALTSITDPHIVIGKKKIADNDDMVSCVPFFKGRTVNFIILDGRQYVVGTKDGIYCSGDRYSGWHRVGEQGDDYLLDSFEKMDCRCCIQNPYMGTFNNSLDNYEFLMGTNSGVYGFSIAYDYGDDVHWEMLQYQLMDVEINFLQLDPIEKCLFIGTNQGLYKYDGSTLTLEKKSYKYRSQTLARLEDSAVVNSNERLLLGTEDGILQSTNAYFPTKVDIMDKALSSMDVTSLGMNSSETTVEWLGTAHGLYRLDNKTSPVIDNGRVYGTAYVDDFLYASMGGAMYIREGWNWYTLQGGNRFPITAAVDSGFKEVYKVADDILLVVCDNQSSSSNSGYLYYIDTLEDPYSVVNCQAYKRDFGKINSITVHGDDIYISSTNGIHIMKVDTLYGHVVNRNTPFKRNVVKFLYTLPSGKFLVTYRTTEDGKYHSGILSEDYRSFTNLRLDVNHYISWAYVLDNTRAYIGVCRNDGTVHGEYGGLKLVSLTQNTVTAEAFKGQRVHGVAGKGGLELYVYTGNPGGPDAVFIMDRGLSGATIPVVGTSDIGGPRALYGFGGNEFILGAGNKLRLFSVADSTGEPVYDLDVDTDIDLNSRAIGYTVSHRVVKFPLSGLPNASGPFTMPDVVGVDDFGDYSIVRMDKRMVCTNPGNYDTPFMQVGVEGDVNRCHLLLEQEFPEARTNGMFVLSSGDTTSGLVIDYISSSTAGIQVGEEIVTVPSCYTASQLQAPQLARSLVGTNNIVGLGHVSNSRNGLAGIAIGTTDRISVFLKKGGAYPISDMFKGGDWSQRMADELSGKTIDSTANGTYIAAGHEFSASPDGITKMWYPSEVDGRIISKGSYMVSSMGQDYWEEIVGDQEVRHYFDVVTWRNRSAVGTNDSTFAMMDVEDTWVSMTRYGSDPAIADLSCLGIAFAEIFASSTMNFEAMETYSSGYNLSCDSQNIIKLVPIFLTRNSSGTRKVYLDLSTNPPALVGGLTEMTGFGSEVPQYVTSFLNCAIIATDRSIRYFISTGPSSLNTISNFGSWSVLASGSSIRDVKFCGNRLDIVGTAIVGSDAKRFALPIATLDWGSLHTGTNWKTSTVMSGLGSSDRLFSQAKWTNDPMFLTPYRYGKTEADRIDYYGYNTGYEQSVYIVKGGRLYRRHYTKATRPAENTADLPSIEQYNQARAADAVGYDAEELATISGTVLGVAENIETLSRNWRQVFIEVSSTGSSVVSKTLLLVVGYDFSSPTKVVDAPSGTTIQRVCLQEIDLGGDPIYGLAYTYGNASGTAGVGCVTFSSTGAVMYEGTGGWAATAFGSRKATDVSFSYFGPNSTPYLVVLGELEDVSETTSHYKVFGYPVGTSTGRGTVDFNRLLILCDDDVFVKPSSPSPDAPLRYIDVLGLVHGNYGAVKFVTGPRARDTYEAGKHYGYSICRLAITDRTKRRVEPHLDDILPMSEGDTDPSTSFTHAYIDNGQRLAVVCFSEAGNKSVFRAYVWKKGSATYQSPYSRKVGEVKSGNDMIVPETGPKYSLLLDTDGMRMYFKTDTPVNSVASVSLSEVFSSASESTKFVVGPKLEKVHGMRASYAVRRLGEATEPDKKDAIVFGTAGGLFTWGPYHVLSLNTERGEQDESGHLINPGHIAYQQNATEDLYDVSHCAVWETRTREEGATEDTITTNYVFTFDIEVYSVRFSFLSSNMESLTMQTDNVCDGIVSLADGNYLLNLRDTMKVLDIDNSKLINLELEDLETIYKNTANDFDDNLYNLTPMQSSKNKTIFLMVNGNALAAFRSYGIYRCFERPRGEYRIMQKRFWNRDVREIWRYSDRDFLIGCSDATFFVRNLEICTCYLDRFGKMLRNETRATASCLQDMSKGLKPKYLFSSGDKIYYSTDTINCGEEITTLSSGSRILNILAENDTMYSICTNVGLYITDLGYDIDDELHRFSIENVSALVREDLEPMVKGHVLRNHEQDEFWLSMYQKAPAALAKVPAGFTNTAGLDLNNAVYIVQNDVVSKVEFNDSNKYVKAAVSNWATDKIAGESIFAYGTGFIDRATVGDKTFDLSKVTYCCKMWESGLREFIIYVPTTLTFYMNNPQGFSNSEYSGKSVSRPNVGTSVSMPNVPNSQYTTLRITFDNNHFKLRNISQIQINGTSLPLKIYKDDHYCQEGRENLFDGVIEPSEVVTIPSIDPATNDTQNNVEGLVDELGNLTLEFAVYGSDAQSIRVIGNI